MPLRGMTGILQGFGKNLASTAHRHSDPEKTIDNRDRHIDTVAVTAVITGVMVINVLFDDPAVVTGMMIDMLLHPL